MASNEQIFAAIILSIIATSTFIGVVNLAYNNQLPDFSSTSVTIPGQVSFQPNSQQGSVFFTEQNYSIANGIDPNTTKIISGHWEQDAAGYHTIQDEESIVVLNNIQPAGSTYTVKYTVDNTAGVSYFVTPRFITLMSIFGNINGQTASDIRVIFDSNGIHIKKYPLGIFGEDQGDYFFYPLPNAQTTITGGSIIITTLKNEYCPENSQTLTTNSVLSVSKDGVTYFTTQVSDVFQTTFAYYGGYGSNYAGFNMYSVNANFYRASQSTQTQYSNLLDALIGTILSWTDSVVQFVNSLVNIVRFSINSDICPLWTTALVMTPQFAVLILIGIKLIRGTS
jgi:hypothetical protein